MTIFSRCISQPGRGRDAVLIPGHQQHAPSGKAMTSENAVARDGQHRTQLRHTAKP